MIQYRKNIRGVTKVNDLFNYIDSQAEEYIDFLKNICSFEGTARDKNEIDKMLDYITEFAQEKGFTVERVPFEKCGDFLIIDINKNSKKGSVFLAHTDTVHKKGIFGYPCVKIENGRMQGPGTIDCKGGIAIALLTMDALINFGYKEHTRLILTSDEEISNVLGGEKEQQFFKETVSEFKNALNCETTKNNEVVVSRKGILRLRVDVKGIGGHSGIEYFNASSAVLEAAKKIVELESASMRGGTTYNCSIINGGTVANIIPNECSFTVDVRVVNLDNMKEAEEFINKVANTSYVKGTTSKVTKISSRMPMLKNDETMELYNALSDISIKYSLGELAPVESGGGSDSAYTQLAGVPSLCGLGGSGDLCHTNKEYIDLDSIFKRAKILSAFCIEQEKQM